MSIESNLEKLSNINGVTGREEAVRNVLSNLIKPYVASVSEDKLGNLIATKKGDKSKPKIMLAAHMDEIGLMVKNISKEGFIQFAKMGGIDDRILLAQKVIVHTDKDDHIWLFFHLLLLGDFEEINGWGLEDLEQDFPQRILNYLSTISHPLDLFTCELLLDFLTYAVSHNHGDIIF